MDKHTVIRGEFIRRYADLNQKMWDKRQNMLARRDELHGKLNRCYGFIEEDGSVGTGRKTYDNSDYKRKYDAIDSQFRGQYDNLTPKFDQWCHENWITIFEYLLFDNIEDDDLSHIAESTATTESWRFDPIGLKARLCVERLAPHHSVGEIKRNIDLEIRHQGYANARCRTFFAISRWEILKHKTIYDYGQRWKSALLQAFGNLKAS